MEFLFHLIGLFMFPDKGPPAIGRVLFGLVGAALGAKFASYLSVDHWVDYALMALFGLLFFILFAKIWRKYLEKSVEQ